LIPSGLFTQVVLLRVFRTGLIIMVVYLRFKKERSFRDLSSLSYVFIMLLASFVDYLIILDYLTTALL
jgi:hypothetical protein